MTWATLLLADTSPNLRLLVLRELIHSGDDDPEIKELLLARESDPIIQKLLTLQYPDGSWRSRAGGGSSWKNIRSTAFALNTLGYLGFDAYHPAVKKGVEYLFSLQAEDGSWALPKIKAERELGEEYSMIPLQTGLPLRSLAAVGCGTDPRAERAYDWLLEMRLPDGAWPSGVNAGKHVFPGGYRRLAHSRYGCRSNTTFALCALALHPTRRESDEARRGLDLLLAQETLQAHSIGIEVARMIGVERKRGFFTYFARNDPALTLDLCWRIGASFDDERVAELVDFIKERKGAYGIWEYQRHPAASRWVTFDLLRSLSRIDQHTDWISKEPRTPFQPYPKEERRY